MTTQLIEKTRDSGLKIRPDNCAIFYDRRSGNHWYKAKGDTPSKNQNRRRISKNIKKE